MFTKECKLFCFSLLIINLCHSQLSGQNLIRDSLIDESLKDFFEWHEGLINKSDNFMIDVQTFPSNYQLSKWVDKSTIEIADFNNKKIIKRYKRSKLGIPTIRFKWTMNQDGSLTYNIGLYYVKIKRRIVEFALAEVCVYCYKYSNSEKKWVMVSKRCSGV